MKDTTMKNCRAPINPPCDKKVYCKGLCKGHYARLSRGQAVGVILRKNKSGAIPKHGGSGSRLYHIWKQMRQRCTNPNHVYHFKYAGMWCEEWNDFVSFREWALSNGYHDSLSINRMDNDLPYSPQNCEWATQSQQMRNTGRSKLITINEETKTMVEWSEDPRCEVSYFAIRSRLNNGWNQSVELIRKKRKNAEE